MDATLQTGLPIDAFDDIGFYSQLGNMFSVKGGTLIPSEGKDTQKKVKVYAKDDLDLWPPSNMEYFSDIVPSPPLNFRENHCQWKHSYSSSPSEHNLQPKKKRSRRKIRFADEEGEDLEHVREFKRDISEEEESGYAHMRSLHKMLKNDVYELDFDEDGVLLEDYEDDVFLEDDVFIGDLENSNLCFEEENLCENAQNVTENNNQNDVDLNNNCDQKPSLSNDNKEIENTHDTIGTDLKEEITPDNRKYLCELPSIEKRLNSLKKSNVVLEGLTLDEPLMYGTVLVKSGKADCQVKVRVTFNDWDTFEDVPATLHNCSKGSDFEDSISDEGSDGEGCSMEHITCTNEDISTYEFDIHLPKVIPKDIQFAVCLELDGRPYWDCSIGDHYVVKLV